MTSVNQPTASTATRPSRHRPPPVRGFSLIELLIVLTIISIAVLLAVPMFGEANIAKLRSAALLLQADLTFAQNDSISHGNDPRVVVFDTTNHRYHIAAASDPVTPLTNSLDGRPYVVDFGSGRAHGLQGVTISAISVGGDDRLQFEVFGQLDQTVPATITLGCGGRTLTITVDPATGEPSIGAIT